MNDKIVKVMNTINEIPLHPIKVANSALLWVAMTYPIFLMCCSLNFVLVKYLRPSKRNSRIGLYEGKYVGAQ